MLGKGRKGAAQVAPAVLPPVERVAGVILEVVFEAPLQRTPKEGYSKEKKREEADRSGIEPLPLCLHKKGFTS